MSQQECLFKSIEILFEERSMIALKNCLEHSDYKKFNDTFLLKLEVQDISWAFTHSSFSHEFEVPNQELLEFHGDAVLQLIITNKLLALYQDAPEGKLSKLRSSLVNAKTLGQIALELNLQKLILVGKGEYSRKTFEAENVLADSLEALIGILFRRHGLAFTETLVLSWFEKLGKDVFDLTRMEEFDAKSKLQEYSLKHFKKLPEYKSHSMKEGFEVQVWLDGKLKAKDIFNSKKLGEKELAARVLNELK